MNPNRIFQDAKLAAIHNQACYEELAADIKADGDEIDWDVSHKEAAINFIMEELMTEWWNRKTLNPKQAQPFIMAEANEIYAEWVKL